MSFSASVPVMSSTQHAPSNSKRHSANFAPSIWQDTFLKYADSDPLGVNETMKQEVQMHKEKVKMYLSSNDNNILQKLNLIDSIQRLSISHHFEREIDEILAEAYNNFTNNSHAIEKYDLHFTALFFRLLRQKGYYISSDVFRKFKNKKGEFDDIFIVQDVQGMWSMFEAAQLRVHGENILDEAHEFTYNKLKSIPNQLNSSLAYQINQSLGQPLHKTILRMRARSYMSFYKEFSSHVDKVDLLNFAKLDFNMLQKLYQKEVGNNTKWWKESDFATKVPYGRERIAEVYFWAYATNTDPKYSNTRRIIAKMCVCMTLVDDTYDVYGTIQELELFTQAIKRWDFSCIASLPECFKVVFNAIEDLWVEIELSTRSNLVLQHLKETFFNYVQGYMIEAKWCSEGHIPTYDEYKVNGALTAGYPLLTTTFIALEEFATKEMIDWISSIPLILKAASVIGRLMNDVAGHKFEQQRNHVASAVECCMKQYDVSQEKAYELINKDINSCWKDINKEYLKLNENIPKPILDCIVNLARICEVLYANYEDKVTSGNLKDHIVALLLDPIILV